MSTTYNQSNNIKTSLYYFIATQLIADGLSYNLIMGFENAYSVTLPVIAIRSRIKNLIFAEIGSTKTTKDHTIMIDIFARSEDEKNDMKDWLTDILINGCDYNTYVIGDDREPIETETDYKIIVKSINEENINFNSDLSGLSEHDKYRYRLNLAVTTNEVV